jgi:hypothetical protein
VELTRATSLLAGALVDGAKLIGGAPSDAGLRKRVEAALLQIVRGLLGAHEDR